MFLTAILTTVSTANPNNKNQRFHLYVSISLSSKRAKEVIEDLYLTVGLRLIKEYDEKNTLKKVRSKNNKKKIALWSHFPKC